MYQIALMWWILSTAGGGGREVGAFLICGALPSILLVKRIGRLIERRHGRDVLLRCYLSAFVVIGVIASALFGSFLTLHMVYAAGFLTSLLQAFIDPTLNKMLPEIVEKADLEAAIAFQSSTQSLSNFGGAVLGAVLIGALGFPGLALLNSLCYLASAVCVSAVLYERNVKTYKPDGGGPSETAGWRLLDDKPVLRRILVSFGLINFFVTPTLIVLPFYTKNSLSAGANTLGMLEASLWIGLLAGTISAKHVNLRRGTVKLGALCVFVLGVCFMLPGLFINRYFYMLMLFTGCFALGINNVKFIALFHEAILPAKKGRFFALLQATVSFTFPVAYFLFGMLADLFSPPRICLIQGFGAALLAVYLYKLADPLKIEMEAA
jgi:MFS family permease